VKKRQREIVPAAAAAQTAEEPPSKKRQAAEPAAKQAAKQAVKQAAEPAAKQAVKQAAKQAAEPAAKQAAGPAGKKGKQRGEQEQGGSIMEAAAADAAAAAAAAAAAHPGLAAKARPQSKVLDRMKAKLSGARFRWAHCWAGAGLACWAGSAGWRRRVGALPWCRAGPPSPAALTCPLAACCPGRRLPMPHGGFCGAARSMQAARGALPASICPSPSPLAPRPSPPQVPERGAVHPPGGRVVRAAAGRPRPVPAVPRGLQGADARVAQAAGGLGHRLAARQAGGAGGGGFRVR
jgi:hypothetical protein